MITFTEPALIGLAALITSLSALIWSIRRRAWAPPLSPGRPRLASSGI